MNPLLSRLQPYPFERLRELFAGVTPNPDLRPISLGIGEPKHPTPEFIKQALNAAMYDPSSDLAAYPPTAGTPKLREAFTLWLQRRYAITVDAATQVLPVGLPGEQTNSSWVRAQTAAGTLSQSTAKLRAGSLGA
jgi:N-succinyldiaminopimelate aminotransferase